MISLYCGGIKNFRSSILEGKQLLDIGTCQIHSLRALQTNSVVIIPMHGVYMFEKANVILGGFKMIVNSHNCK